MMRYHQYLIMAAFMALTACSSEDDALQSVTNAEIQGIVATIDEDEPKALTRAAEGTDSKVKIGRSEFAAGETIVFTSIKRTTSPLIGFTYSDIRYFFTENKNWKRTEGNLPEKIYWTDGTSPHTFIGYSLASQTYDWTDNSDNTFSGELGCSQIEEASYTTDNLIDYTTGNEALKKEDLLLNYNTKTVAETGGLSTKVTFTHALSNVRVVVNIKNFASSAGAVDTKVGVSDMILLDQPTKFNWGIYSSKVQTLDFENQTTKHLKLWCPAPAGEGTGQNKTFTFYGITTPQDVTYHNVNGNNKPLKFSFTVTYPDPLNPDETLTKTYMGQFNDLVHFNPGMCTTINISLNHKDEEMFMGVDYYDWNFVSTPDLGELRKKSTFLNVTIDEVTDHFEDRADANDATWLYIDKANNNVLKDIYGNDGSADAPYRISTAPQMLSFAKEVSKGYDFTGKYIRLDADITLQKSATDSTYVWNGIGDATHAFNGTFLGGDRFINRLNGHSLFANLGTSACVEQLQMTTLGSIVEGALAGINAGVVGACRVIDDAESTTGTLVGTNKGIVYACYQTGEHALIGTTDGGQTIGCYTGSDISSLIKNILEELVNRLNNDLNAWYDTNQGKTHTQYKFTYSAGSYPTVQKK